MAYVTVHTHAHTHTQKLLSRVRLFATPWIVAHQAPQFMGFSRHEYWSGFAISFSRCDSSDTQKIKYVSSLLFSLFQIYPSFQIALPTVLSFSEVDNLCPILATSQQ